MDQLDIGWLAGIIEGEGYLKLSCPKGSSYCYPAIVVEMLDEDIINRLQDITGVGRIRKEPRPGRPNANQMHVWKVSVKKDVARLLLAIYPLLGERKQNQVAALAPHLSPNRYFK